MLSARSEVMCRQFDTITIAGMLVGRAVFDALAAIPFFAGLERDALERLAGSMRSRRFRRGEVIFHLGDPGDALFVIVSGDVKISLPSETGEEAILATLGSGAVFGELALLDGAPRSASATAQTATETVVLPRDRFRELIATEAGVRDALLASIAGELRRLTTHVEELHFLDITGRLAARLVRLAVDGGTRLPDGGIRLRKNLTQGDLASMSEREQAAGPIHRRRADPPRTRGDRGDRPGRVDRDLAALGRPGGLGRVGRLARGLEQDGRGDQRGLAPAHRPTDVGRPGLASLAVRRDDRHGDGEFGPTRADAHGQPGIDPGVIAHSRRAAGQAGIVVAVGVEGARLTRHDAHKCEPRRVAEQCGDLAGRSDLLDGETPA
jgi:CRP-like cAMP-binding protein